MHKRPQDKSVPHSPSSTSQFLKWPKHLSAAGAAVRDTEHHIPLPTLHFCVNAGSMMGSHSQQLDTESSAPPGCSRGKKKKPYLNAPILNKEKKEKEEGGSWIASHAEGSASSSKGQFTAPSFLAGPLRILKDGVLPSISEALPSYFAGS